MSVASVVTQGFGSFGTVNLVVTDGYGSGEAPPEPPVVEVVQRGGTSKRDKKRKRHLTYAEAALRAEAGLLQTPLDALVDADVVPFDEETEDDEIVLMLLARLLH